MRSKKQAKQIIRTCDNCGYTTIRSYNYAKCPQCNKGIMIEPEFLSDEDDNMFFPF